jgi:hypothetical protein
MACDFVFGMRLSQYYAINVSCLWTQSFMGSLALCCNNLYLVLLVYTKHATLPLNSHQQHTPLQRIWMRDKLSIKYCYNFFMLCPFPFK